MHIMKIRWKSGLLLLTVLAMTATLVAGCAEEEKPKITFYDGSWGCCWLSNAIAMFIVEEGYGYETESIMMTTEVMQVSHPKGDVLVNLEQGPQNLPEWYNEQIESGTLEELGYPREDNPQFWCIPQWVHEQYNINTVEDMKEHWELFKDPADPSKGMFIDCMLGWKCGEINDIKMEAYGLTEYYNIMEPGSAGAEAAAMAGPQKKHEPVFGYYWAPTELMGMFDWYILEEPAYDPEVWSKIIDAMNNPELRPIDEACAYQPGPPTITVHHSLRDKAPDVVAMLEKYTLGLDRTSKALAWQSENEVQDWEKVAVWFLREYDSIWKTWVTTDAYNKIKAVVDDYGEIP